MRRRVGVTVVIAAILGVASWVMRSRPAPAPKETPVQRTRVSSPVRGQPCRVDVEVRDGRVRTARLFSSRAQIDVAATIEGDGFFADLPEQGRVFVVAESMDGRSTARWITCGGDGVVRAILRFPARDKSAATIDGRCVYLDTGAPVAGGVVRGRYDSASDAVVSAMADDDGVFRLQVPAGDYVFRCAKDADLGPPQRVSVDAEDQQTIELFVEARAGVSIVVLDHDGQPVEDVLVLGRPARAARDAEPIGERTDADGRVLLMGFVPGPVSVEAQHEGRFAEGHAVARVELPYAEVNLTLATSPVTLNGRVMDGKNAPVEGAQIEVQEIGGSGVRAQAPIRRTTRSDPEGRFSVGGLLSGKHNVRATAPGMAAAELDLNLIVGPTHVTLRLLAACTATIKVLPDEPSIPVRISIRRDDDVTWDVAGRTGEVLSLPDVSGNAKLFARTTGALVKTATASGPLCGAPIVMNLRGDESSGALVVRVRDENNDPVDGAEVWVDAPAGRARTDGVGEVRFDGLEARTYRVATVDALEPKSVEVQAGSVADVELVIDRKRGDVRGTVVAGSAPVEGASILASCGDSGRGGRLSNASVVARSDPSGGFAFTPRGGGVCEVRAEHASRGRSRAVTLQAGGDPATIRLDVGATIAGRVITMEGAPVTPYTLIIRTSGSAAAVETRTQYVAAADGAFRVEEVAPGRVSLRVNAPGGRGFVELDVRTGEVREGVEIRVFTQGQVTGRVVARDGEPVFRAGVELRSAGTVVGRSATGKDGRFSVRAPAGEPIRVQVNARGFYPRGTPPVSMVPGGPTDVGNITLERRGGPEEKQAGIGIMIAGDARGIRIIRFVDNSPAREAGLAIGDIIVGIDGVPAGREPLMNWVVSLRGPVGTPVTLEVERGTQAPFVVTITRREVGLGALPERAP